MTLKDHKKEARKFKVTKAYAFENGNVAINLQIDDITIYDCILVKKKNPKKGENEYFISFPQKKVGKEYYSIVYTQLSSEEEEDIINQIDELV